MSGSFGEYRWSLQELVWRLVPLAQSGNDLIGLGEVLDAISSFNDSADEDDDPDADENPKVHEVDINVGLDVGFRAGDENVAEGVFCGVRVSDEGIEFDLTQTFYSRSVGSDHSTNRLAFIRWDGDIEGEPFSWFRRVEQVLSQKGCALTVSRDHA
jgi:hypothetical protein